MTMGKKKAELLAPLGFAQGTTKPPQTRYKTGGKPMKHTYNN